MATADNHQANKYNEFEELMKLMAGCLCRRSGINLVVVKRSQQAKVEKAKRKQQ